MARIFIGDAMQTQQLLKSAHEELHKGNLEKSHQHCLSLLKLQPKNAEAHFLLGLNALSRNQLSKAITLLKVTTQLDTNTGRYWVQLSRAYSQGSQQEECLSSLNKALQLQPEDTMSIDTLGVLLTRIGNHQLAEQYFKKSLSRAPSNPEFIFNLASSLRINGHLEQALCHYQKLYQIKPDFYDIYTVLAELSPKDKLDKLYIKFTASLDELEANNKLDDEKKTIYGLQISHGLAKLLERQNHLQQSIDTLIPANNKRRLLINYTTHQDMNLFDEIINNCSPEFFKEKGSFQDDSAIFIIGMPRTGTTLLERILSHHDNVTSAGELQNFSLQFKQESQASTANILDIETVKAYKNIDYDLLGQHYIKSIQHREFETSHFTDKLPLNYLYAGFIHKALPNAKIICLRRNPLDTVLSNFKQLFSINYSFYNYAYQLEDCARYYVYFNKLISHWRNTIGNSHFHEIHYEDIVSNTQQTIHNATNFLHLDWQSQVLDFHNNQQAIATASAAQARKPIYKSSINRWRQVENSLSSVKAIFDQAGIKY